MFQALFNSLSGLFSFSKSLNTVSNNVANMNTPGFRGTDTFFENVNGEHGTRISGEGLRTTAGDLRQTGTSTDAAIDGNGFFVLQDSNGNLFYTRAGQFRFNDDGVLTDSVTGYKVMSLDASGNLQPIDMINHRSLPAEKTTAVNIRGNIAPLDDAPSVSTFTVYDASGISHTLSVTLTKTSAVGATTPVTFHVKVTNEVGATLLDTTSSNIEFNQLDGTPIANFNTLDVPLSGTQTISLNFGAVGTTSGVRITAGATTSLAGQVVDGHPELGLNSLSWDEKGILQFVYSASEKVAGPQLALASFTNQDALEMIGGRLFTGGTAADRTIGRPDSGVFGKIVGGSLELANVDLTQEFADMIIIQRGYQASSRVMTVSNQMIEELYNSGRGG